MNRRLEEMGPEELVMLCPNCYHFLKGRLGVRVTDIYTKLEELGLGQKVPGRLQVSHPARTGKTGNCWGRYGLFWSRSRAWKRMSSAAAWADAAV